MGLIAEQTSNSTIPVLKFLICFEQGVPHFHFGLALANSVADPGLLVKC